MKPDFIEIFQSIRAVLQPYTAVGFETSINSDTAFELYTAQVVTLNHKNQKLYFAGVKILKNQVSFYLMFIYMHPELNQLLHPDLLQLLKGKCCFHIKKLDDHLLNLISQALDIGFTHYKQQGWA